MSEKEQEIVIDLIDRLTSGKDLTNNERLLVVGCLWELLDLRLRLTGNWKAVNALKKEREDR